MPAYQALVTSPTGAHVGIERVRKAYPTAEVEDATHGLFLIELNADDEATLLQAGWFVKVTPTLRIEAEMP